jgi:signal transduction histidine kinase
MCEPTDCRYLSQATHLLLTVGNEGEIRSTDPRRGRALGYDTAALPGLPLSDLVPEAERGHLARLLERTDHAPAVWDRLTFARGDGRHEPLLCCFQRLRGADQPQGAILVTGLRLEPVQQHLRAEAAAALGHLAFTCHTPAHRLMQAVEALLAECPTSHAAQRCRDDLEGLLDALSQAAAWPKANGRPVDAVAVVEAALASLEGDEAFARLAVALRPESPAAWTTVHPAALAYVTLHVAANARDATARTASPRLCITVTAERKRVVVEFQDNGCGLDADDRASALAPCAAGACRQGGRAGVGLASCRQVLEHFGGTLRLHGRPNQGATVVVALPAAKPPA